MECLVFARQLRQINLGPARTPSLPATSRSAAIRSEPCRGQDSLPTLADLQHRIQELRQLCWQVAGVEREPAPLRDALLAAQQQAADLASVALLDQVAHLPSDAHLPLDGSTGSWLRSAHDLQQRLRLAALLLEAALFRQESRGGHYRLDAPAAQPFWRCHTLHQRWQRIHTEAVGAGRTTI